MDTTATAAVMSPVKQSHKAANFTFFFIWSMEAMMGDYLKDRQHDKYLSRLVELSMVMMDFIDSTNINCEDVNDRKTNLAILYRAQKIYLDYCDWDKLDRSTNIHLEPMFEAWYRIKGLLPKELENGRLLQ